MVSAPMTSAHDASVNIGPGCADGSDHAKALPESQSRDQRERPQSLAQKAREARVCLDGESLIDWLHLG